MALILLSWLWNRVTANCNGGQESIAYYQFRATMRVYQWGKCPTGSGNKTYDCKLMAPVAPQVFGPKFSDPGAGSTVVTTFDPIVFPAALPNPPVGGFSAWPWPSPENPNPVVAVDYGGNSSGDNICR